MCVLRERSISNNSTQQQREKWENRWAMPERWYWFPTVDEEKHTTSNTKHISFLQRPMRSFDRNHLGRPSECCWMNSRRWSQWSAKPQRFEARFVGRESTTAINRCSFNLSSFDLRWPTKKKVQAYWSCERWWRKTVLRYNPIWKRDDLRCRRRVESNLLAELEFTGHVGLPMCAVEGKEGEHTCPKHQPRVDSQLYRTTAGNRDED